MSVKKLLSLSFAAAIAFIAGPVSAGGPEIIPPPPVESGIYIDADMGYASVDWFSVAQRVFAGIENTIYFNSQGNKKGGFTFGGDAGYQFNRFLGAEVGAYYLPQVNFAIVDEDIPELVATDKVISWIFYVAGKLMVPVPFIDNLDIFFKAGGAYRNLTIKTTLHPTEYISDNNLNPMFAIGLQYHLTPNLSIDGQWLHVADGGPRPGFTVTVPILAVPADNLFTFGVGYFFKS